METLGVHLEIPLTLSDMLWIMAGLIPQVAILTKRRYEKMYCCIYHFHLPDPCRLVNASFLIIV